MEFFFHFQEEKERKKFAKNLPKFQKTVEDEISAWENENDDAFLLLGFTVQDYFKHVEEEVGLFLNIGLCLVIIQCVSITKLTMSFLNLGSALKFELEKLEVSLRSCHCVVTIFSLQIEKSTFTYLNT